MYVGPYGTASWNERGSVTLYADSAMLWNWANRPDAVWLCSELSRLDEITVRFAPNGDLVDLETRYAVGNENGDEIDADNLTSDELNAWSSDVMRASGFLSDHPAIRS